MVVVDSSELADARSIDDLTMPAEYLHTPEFAGWRTRARNAPLPNLREEVIAYVDDDVVVHTGWAHELRMAYSDAKLAATCGRTRNLIAGEETYNLPIGRILPNGTLTDGFAAVVPEPLEIDHGIGANMAFRATALRSIHGFRHLYPGTALREETDVFLRLRRVDATMRFLPTAVVDHLPAPHVVGDRFDVRYKLYSRRNHVVLLAKTYGATNPILRRWLREQTRQIGNAGGPRRIVERGVITALGCGWGFGALVASAVRRS